MQTTSWDSSTERKDDSLSQAETHLACTLLLFALLPALFKAEVAASLRLTVKHRKLVRKQFDIQPVIMFVDKGVGSGSTDSVLKWDAWKTGRRKTGRKTGRKIETREKKQTKGDKSLGICREFLRHLAHTYKYSGSGMTFWSDSLGDSWG